MKDDKIQSYIDKHGNSYKIGGKPIGTANKMNYSFLSDHVYLEMNKSNEPYSIACILDFRLVNVFFFDRSVLFFMFPLYIKTRKDHVLLEVCWYYRPSEIPVNLYHLLIEDRYHENRM